LPVVERYLKSGGANEYDIKKAILAAAFSIRPHHRTPMFALEAWVVMYIITVN
jgi:hypothetical protein